MRELSSAERDALEATLDVCGVSAVLQALAEALDERAARIRNASQDGPAVAYVRVWEDAAWHMRQAAAHAAQR